MRPALIVGLLCASLQATVVAAEPAVQDAWIALGPPDSTALAGYLTLHNPGAHAITLVAVSSPAFASVALHRTEQAGDSMRMRPVSQLEVPAGARVELAPGGTHLMLFEPRMALLAGQRLVLTLRFADGATLAVDATVRDPRRTAAEPRHHAGAH